MLNDRARQMLAHIQKFTVEHGYPPTIRELGKAFGITSTNGVRYYLNLLERAGHLKRSGRISRGLGTVGVAAARRRSAGIPILGRVAAGVPALAEESLEGHLETNALFGLLEDEATVKYYRPRGAHIELVAANPRYQPIVVGRNPDRDATFRILGVVIGVLRTLGR